mmetsp:Transcript_10802/g.18181  ORF Transcript_10802/g.18181 Transcript_10802/m.18181 type:complete len:181 (-) Transcript_10802:1479-2021(-)
MTVFSYNVSLSIYKNSTNRTRQSTRNDKSTYQYQSAAAVTTTTTRVDLHSAASLHIAGPGFLWLVTGLQVGDGGRTHPSLGEQAAEGLQAVLCRIPINITRPLPVRLAVAVVVKVRGSGGGSSGGSDSSGGGGVTVNGVIRTPEHLCDGSCAWPHGIVQIGGVHCLCPHTRLPSKNQTRV